MPRRRIVYPKNSSPSERPTPAAPYSYPGDALPEDVCDICAGSCIVSVQRSGSSSIYGQVACRWCGMTGKMDPAQRAHWESCGSPKGEDAVRLNPSAPDQPTR